MEQPDKKSDENNFLIFIIICVVIALVLVFVGLFLYRSTGTQDLDQSLPVYVKGHI